MKIWNIPFKQVQNKPKKLQNPFTFLSTRILMQNLRSKKKNIILVKVMFICDDS